MIILCQKLLKNTKINGIALFPFILLKNETDVENTILINHEKIHLRQQLELGIVFFYIWYVMEYYYFLYRTKNKYIAYRSISFEKEAYDQEANLFYLENRPFWQFRKYLF